MFKYSYWFFNVVDLKNSTQFGNKSISLTAYANLLIGIGSGVAVKYARTTSGPSKSARNSVFEGVSDFVEGVLPIILASCV